MKITAIIEREGTGYVALCPEFDIASQGDDILSARNNLQEAIELFLSAHPRRKYSSDSLEKFILHKLR